MQLTIGLSCALRKILYNFLEVENLSDKDFNCLLALSESIEENLEKLYQEICDG